MEIEDLNKTKRFRQAIEEFEKALIKTKDSFSGQEACDKKNPVKHTFIKDCYIREILMPKGQTLTTQIHKQEHPFFFMIGDVTIISPDGTERIKAPYQGITKPGTKRIIITHEDTILITVHPTDKKTIKEVQEEVIAKDFNDPKVVLNQNNK